MIGIAAAWITIQIGAAFVLSGLGVPVPVSAAIGAGLTNLFGQEILGGQNGIDWGSVGLASVEGLVFSMAGSGLATSLGREIWQQGKSGFDSWVSGSGLNWSGIAGSLFNVGFDTLDPVLGGPKVGTFNFGLGRLINSAYNPRPGGRFRTVDVLPWSACSNTLMVRLRLAWAK